MNEKIRLGISSCLLGEQVRYNGQHKWDRFLTETLGKYVQYVPVCPEVECGLPVPREAMRLVGNPESPRLVTYKTKVDMTGKMMVWAEKKLKELEKEELSGFIFKAKSPSSGMERVKVYNTKGGLAGRSSGMFAAAFIKKFPLLPVEDEGRLHDSALRENFIERVFTLDRYRKSIKKEQKAKTIINFHAQHKLLLMSHSPECARTMGRCVARLEEHPLDQLIEEYENTLKHAMKLHATPARHTNVMHHILGYFKKQLQPFEKQEMLEIISQFKQGNLPLIVPITLLKHYTDKYNATYLQQQYYLWPHPIELKLRNHS